MTAVLDRPSAGTRTGGGGSGWRPALRIAARELRRAPARTAMVLLMVLLPVTAVVALDTLLRTGEVSAVESLPRDLGDAAARLDMTTGTGVLRQTPDLSRTEGAGAPRPVSEAALGEVLPAGSRLLAVRESGQERGVRTADGRVSRAVLLAADLSDPELRGPYVVERGAAPDSAGEVAVTAELERFGFTPGSTVVLPGGRERVVTGTVRYPRNYGAVRTVLGLPEAVGLQDAAVVRYYVGGPPVTWDDVLELNGLGVAVLSRAVLLDPPAEDRVPEFESYGQPTTVAVIGLIAVMAVLEVVLLAGPAFAVGARRQRRALALLAASGGEPRHVRRVVLAQGLLVGLGAAALGVPLGIAAAALARAPLTRYAGAEWGPFEVSLRDVVLLALLGAGTALLSALVPAVLAARQPVVASLAGQRPPPVRASLPTLAGLVLFTGGALLCVASLDRGFPELWIAFAAIPTVIGAVLLAPALLAALGRIAGRLPLPLRFAVRDADRQRSRTAPAVAAVAATVAAAVALGTAAGSDEEQQRRSYAPSGPPGTAIVTAQGPEGPEAVDWAVLAREARRALPGEPVTEVRGLLLGQVDQRGTYEQVEYCAPGAPLSIACDPLPLEPASGPLGGSVLVGPASVQLIAPLLDPATVVAARRAVEGGDVALFGLAQGPVELRRQRVVSPPEGGETTVQPVATTTATAVPVQGEGGRAPVPAVVSEEVADRLGGATTVGLAVGDALPRAQEERLRDVLTAVDDRVYTTVERGYPEQERLAVLVLGLVAGALVLAGTLAATSLALVEARPDFATLHRVGARPRTRRAVAAAYAGVLALAGSALGTAAGLVPGVAAAVAVTRNGYASSAALGSSPPSSWGSVEVPWLLLAGLLVALPLVAAALAGASARSALPVPARGRS